MAVFKCKMCGGDLEIAEGVTIAECEYCGAKQTVPKATDENLQNIFNRANTLRMKSEFDKAEKLYEKIIQSDFTQSEAYWGLILCKYGIEYVDDPVTFKKIPTCHRASYDSIIADEDYKSALDNADISQRAVYEEQAKEIDRIQKEILSFAQREEGYDIFICYKETDVDGKRTPDSVIANDIYYQLTNEGFKVFYAAITLEGKLGSAYEPIIFAALNSAKVMLAIGTKPEYFNAVWVKNEWSRYLKIIKNDRSKLLIPCYRDMDAYELPDEFAHLQAQDMSKIGFINDVVRGIQKVIPNDEPKKATEGTVAYMAAATNIAPLLKRVFIFLEDGEWNKADDFCEQVLNQDPENAEAYLGKLMAELKVHSKEKLSTSGYLANNNNFQKAVRYADPKLASELKIYAAENEAWLRHTRIYNKAVETMRQAKKESEFIQIAGDFKSISGFLDADAKAKECLKKAEEAKEMAKKAEEERLRLAEQQAKEEAETRAKYEADRLRIKEEKAKEAARVAAKHAEIKKLLEEQNRLKEEQRANQRLLNKNRNKIRTCFTLGLVCIVLLQALICSLDSGFPTIAPMLVRVALFCGLPVILTFVNFWYGGSKAMGILTIILSLLSFGLGLTRLPVIHIILIPLLITIITIWYLRTNDKYFKVWQKQDCQIYDITQKFEKEKAKYDEIRREYDRKKYDL